MMMRKIKYILLSLLSMAVLCILFIALIATTLDDADYRKMVIRAVEFFTGYEVDVEGDFTLDLSTEPYLSVSEVRFEPGKDGSQPYIDHIGQLQVKLGAWHLVTGKLLIKQLTVDDVTLSLSVGEDQQKRSTGARKKKGIFSMLIPVLENAVLENINVNISDQAKGHIAKIVLRHLKVDDTGESGYRHVTGEGVVNGQEFQIEGRLGSFAEVFNQHRPYPVSLNLNTANMDLNVSGSVENFIQKEGLDLHVTGKVAELSNALKLFKKECPGLRHMKLEADVTGNITAPSVSGLHINISGDSDTQITAKGSVSNIFNGDGTDIFITGSTSNNDIIRMFLPPIMADFNQLDIRCRLRKHQADYVFEDIDANGLNDQGLAMKAFGSLNFGDLKRNPFIKEINLDLQLKSPTTNAAKRFLIDWLPEIGPVNGKGQLTGSMHRLSLEDLSIDINESGPLKVTSKGRIGKIPTKKGMNISELDLGVSIQAEETALLSTALDMPLPELGSVSAHFRVYYTDDRLQFNEIDVRTSDMKGLKVALSGRVGEIPSKTFQPYGDVDFRIRMTAPNMGATEPLLGTGILRDIGPVIGEAQITGTTEVLSLESVVITAGHPRSAYAEMRGHIGKIPVSSGRIITECNINGSIHAGEISDLGPLFGISIPSLGPLRGTWRVVDRNGGFGFDDVKLFVGKEKGFLLEAAGKIDSVLRKGKVAVSGADFDLLASVTHVSAVPILADIGLSGLGSLKMTAKMYGGDGGLDIQQLIIHTGQKEKASLLMKGELHGAQRKDKIEVTAKFVTHTQPWVEKLIQRPISESFKLFGRLALIRESDHIRIEVLDIKTEDQQQLSLKANGLVKKMDGSYTMDVQISADAKDPSVFGSMLGISLPTFSPLTASGRFNVNGKKAGFEGEMRFGKTVFKTKAHCSIQNHRPHLDLNIYSPIVYLSDMGIYPEEFIEETDKKKAIQSDSGRLFSKEPLSFDVFKSLDLSLKIDADKLIGKNLEMNHLDFDLSLSDGRLRIGPAKFGYAGGDISFESTLKTVESKPEIVLKANAEDLDVDAFLAYVHKPMILGGQLNLAVDLRGAGNSFHEIASSLEGELGVAIENGRIKRDIEMITADAFDVITDLPKIEDYQELNCLVLKFTFADGVGKSKMIFYDTPNVRTRGSGSVNLVSETLDIVLQPQPKKGIPELSSAIYIHGSLVNPSIIKIPFKEAARLAGEILLPYVFLPARALGYLWYLLMDDKDGKSPCLIEEPNVE
ncbi:MAG: AsmA family protein [Deltaproteobacteria bacterium]|nr:AsmA family protein [Deltaproteobacteria bacterium]